MAGFDEYTGIVVAGFGKKDYVPSFAEYKICGLFPEGLCCKRLGYVTITPSRRSRIRTFAQDEVVKAYLCGIDPDLKDKILEDVESLLDKSTQTVAEKAGLDGYKMDELKKANRLMVEQYKKDLTEYTKRNYLSGTERMISFLSKDEMADMAGSMISFMSLKRRVSEDEETVGGPVDVAVLSRGEGMIWIKRKHYFNRDLNPFYRMD